MKTGKKILIGVVVLAMLVTLLSNIGQVFDLGVKEETAYASIWNSNGTYKEGSITKTGTLGSASNPFMVLEIVPSYRQAQFGYLVGGSEPIDISAVSAMDESGTKTAIAADLTTWLSKSKTEAVFKDFSSSFDTDTWTDYQNNFIVEQTGTADRYAEYRYVGNGGNYRLNITKRVVKTENQSDLSRTYYYGFDSQHIYVYAELFNYGYNPDKFYLEPENDLMGRYDYDAENNLFTYAYEFEELDGFRVPRDGFRYEVIEKDGRKSLSKVYDILYYIGEFDSNDNPRVYKRFGQGVGLYIDLKDSNYFNSGEGQGATGKSALSALNDAVPDAVKTFNGKTYIVANHPDLGNRMISKDADGNDVDYYVFEYVYTFEEVSDGSGDYKLVYKNYEESTEIAAHPEISSQYTGQLTFTEENYDTLPKLADGLYYPSTVPARVDENVQVYTGYKWELVNNETFKKYALGLIYADESYAKGEDISSFEFLGWYYEPECVNAFNETAAIKKNTTLYAKWVAHYSDSTRDSNLSVVFDANTSDPVDGFNFSGAITRLAKGSKIVAPSGTPHRQNYRFTGWYSDAACTHAVSFPYTVNSNTTLYAGWASVGERTYNVKFNTNAPVDAEISGMPGTIITVFSNNRTTGDATALSAFYNDEGVYTAPVRPGYVLGGWYWDSSCSSEFDFYAPIPSGYSYGDITLYALWIPENRLPQYSVYFDRNEPDGAETFASGNIAGFYATYGTTAVANGYSAADHVLTLEGNIKAKLRNYNVQVITVTPKDLSESNLSLIKRANLIVFSEPVMTGSGELASAVGVNTALADRFDTYRDKELFPDGITGRDYSSAKYKFTDSGNDITFAAAKDVLMKIAGIQQKTYGPVCPVIYDYNIYKNVITTGGSTSTYEGKLTDGTSLGLSGTQKKGFTNNLYKLYLMTQQMNPVTLFNAYISSTSPIKGFSIDNSGNFKAEGGSSYSAWNKYTLIPWGSVASADYAKYKSSGITTGFDLVGVTIDTEIPSDFGYSKINNRLLIYNNALSKSLASAFGDYIALPSSGNEEMYKAFGNKVHVGGVYSTADGVHFMLTDTGVQENFDKDLSILELEPAAKYTATGYPESFKSEEYWFWMISRYVPNYSGNTTVTRMSTSQFIGDISEINSLFDIVYIGGNDKGIVSDYMPKAEAKAWFESGEENAFIIGQLAASQTINVPFYKWTNASAEVSQTTKSGYSAVNEHFLGVYWDSASNSLKASTAVGIDPGLKVSATTTNDTYYADYRIWDSTGRRYVYFSSLGDLSYSYVNTAGRATTFKPDYDLYYSDDGNLEYYYYGSWRKFDYLINTYHTKFASGGWTYYSSGSVSDGDRIYLTTRQNLKTTANSTGTYVYAHTGKVLSTSGSNAGDHNGQPSSGSLLTGSTASVLTAATSGNDITNVKYEDLLNFVNAGYPVIVGSDLLTSGNRINESIIDTSSYIYKFLTKLAADYRDVCFYEKTFDAEHEADFLDALKNKSFDLKMAATPIEYRDQTYTGSDWGAEYKGLPDSKVYVNGADPTNKTLKYVFTIDGSTSDTYSLNYFIDTNADGKFNEETEKLDSAEISAVRFVGNADDEEQLANADYYTKVSGATNPKQTRLEAGKTYMLTVYAGEIVGGIPWKIEVTSNKHNLVTDEAQGLCAIKATEKAHAYVLQILPDKDATVVFPDNREVIEAEAHGGRLVSVSDHVNTPYRSGNIYNTAQNFYKFTRDLEDFEVEFFKMTISEFTDFVLDRDEAIADTANGINENSPYWIQTEITELVKAGPYTTTANTFNESYYSEANNYYDVEVTENAEGPKTDRTRNTGSYTAANGYYDVDIETEYSYSGRYTYDCNASDLESYLAFYSSNYYNVSYALRSNGKYRITYYTRRSATGYYNVTYTKKTYTITYYRMENQTHQGDGDIGFVNGVLTCKPRFGNAEEDINMMFIGFADCYGYGDFREDRCCDIINEFITSGKAVLFTHDTTSYYSSYAGKVNGGPAMWGVNINEYFRDILKLDRYNALQYGTDSGEWSYGTVNEDAGDWPFKTGGTQNVSVSNMATTAVNSKNYPLVQGFTNLAMTGQVGSNGTSRVTKSNDGQITTYPYYVPMEMDVAWTHAQYWQIDFEDDDIVVWYTLANPKDQPDLRKCYTTLNDVRNNYYIYSTGNVTYSGVGHSDATLSDEETKLFVNTMVAAYKSITSPAKAVITNADKSSRNEKSQYLYISYDETVAESESTPIGVEITSDPTIFSEEGAKGKIFYKRVFFTVKNYSIVFNKTLTVHLYPKFNDTVYKEYPMMGDNAPIELKVYEYDEYDPDGGEECRTDVFEYTCTDSAGVSINVQTKGYIVETGKNYYVDIPISDVYYSKLFAYGLDSSIVTSDGTSYHAPDLPDIVYEVQKTDDEGKGLIDDYGNPITELRSYSLADTFALDSNSSFSIELEILMRYGKDLSKNKPLSAPVDIIFTRRGLFLLD